jgi:hypothetical protein
VGSQSAARDGREASSGCGPHLLGDGRRRRRLVAGGWRHEGLVGRAASLLLLLDAAAVLSRSLAHNRPTGCAQVGGCRRGTRSQSRRGDVGRAQLGLGRRHCCVLGGLSMRAGDAGKCE